MKVLTDPTSIRNAIRDLLSDHNDERVVAVAYVGQDALKFLPSPQGITVYCWPQAGGTNPTAIEEMIGAGAIIKFVKRMHAKVYWSHSRGALVGSANLSANALGEKALKEATVLLPPGAFDMIAFAKSLQVESDFATTLRQLHEDHIRFSQDNNVRSKHTPSHSILPSFPNWMAKEGRAEWRLGWYAKPMNPPRDAIIALELETGSRKYANFLGVGKDDFKRGVFALGFCVRQDAGKIKIKNIHWWAPETPVRSSTWVWEDCVIWFARKCIPDGTRPPFNARETRFRRALTETINEFGELKWLRGISSLRPSVKFLEYLAESYEANG